MFFMVAQGEVLSRDSKTCSGVDSGEKRRVSSIPDRPRALAVLRALYLQVQPGLPAQELRGGGLPGVREAGCGSTMERSGMGCSA